MDTPTPLDYFPNFTSLHGMLKARLKLAEDPGDRSVEARIWRERFGQVIDTLQAIIDDRPEIAPPLGEDILNVASSFNLPPTNPHLMALRGLHEKCMDMERSSVGGFF